MMHDKLIPKKSVAAGRAISSSRVLIVCLLEQFPMFNLKRHCTSTPFAVHQNKAKPLALHHNSLAFGVLLFNW